MQISSNPTAVVTERGVTPDMAHVVTRVATLDEARCLPAGSLVGDKHGGLTFSDAVAYVLEQRSARGWHEVTAGDGTRWTVIRLNR